MENPSVCAVLLTADRPEYTRQAAECFRRQTYANKRLLVLNNGETIPEWEDKDWLRTEPGCEMYMNRPQLQGKTIGELRNIAIESVCHSQANSQPDIIVHLDSDDWSHANRFSEQMALLQNSGADCVGYNSMLFAREMVRRDLKEETAFNDVQEYGPAKKFQQAWLYSNPNPQYALGTSLCYWRHVWERKPFEATSQGEDDKFLRGLNVAAVSAMDNLGVVRVGDNPPPDCFDVRMIARIHGSNTSTAYSPRKMEAEARKKDGMWKRVPHWDSFCAETMK